MTSRFVHRKSYLVAMLRLSRTFMHEDTIHENLTRLLQISQAISIRSLILYSGMSPCTANLSLDLKVCFRGETIKRTGLDGITSCAQTFATLIVSSYIRLLIVSHEQKLPKVSYRRVAL